jgi:hypothetical protein
MGLIVMRKSNEFVGERQIAIVLSTPITTPVRKYWRPRKASRRINTANGHGMKPLQVDWMSVIRSGYWRA